MAITEADRHEMHEELRRSHGEKVGDIIMEHLPPTGWGDVARVQDVDRLEKRMDQLERRIDQLERRIDQLERRIEFEVTRLELHISREVNRLDGRINNLATAMWAMAGFTVAGFASLFALISAKL